MPTITLQTKVPAIIEAVFDLSRDIDFHQNSLEDTDEKAIAGKTSGLIGMGESVTWHAKHFGFYQTLTSKITEFDSPTFFADEMVRGAFKSFRHEHHFEQAGSHTIMTDVFEYKSPLGIIGRLADFLFLKKYMRNLLVKRNQAIVRHFDSKEAETGTKQ